MGYDPVGDARADIILDPKSGVLSNNGRYLGIGRRPDMHIPRLNVKWEAKPRQMPLPEQKRVELLTELHRLQIRLKRLYHLAPKKDTETEARAKRKSATSTRFSTDEWTKNTGELFVGHVYQPTIIGEMALIEPETGTALGSVVAEPTVLAELRNRMISYVQDDMVMPRKRDEREWESVKNEVVLKVPKERW